MTPSFEAINRLSTGFTIKNKRLDITMALRKEPQLSPSLTELCEDFNEHELLTLNRLGTIVKLPAGSVLANEGAVGQEAIVVISGTALVVRGTETVAEVGPATILGEAALLTGESRNASLIAETDLVVSVLNRREFHSWLDSCPRVATEVRNLASTRG